MQGKKKSTSKSESLYAIAQKNKAPLVVTRAIGGVSVFTRSEFGIRVGVHPSTLRTWEKKGMLVPAYINQNGIRFYTEQQALDFLSAGKKGKHNSERI